MRLEKAKDVLKHIAEIAPYASWNMALLLGEREEKGFSHLMSHQRYTLWRERSLKAGTKYYTKNQMRLISDEAIAISYALLSFVERMGLKVANNQIVQLAKAIASYRFVKKSKTGVCDHLAFSAAFDLFVNKKEAVWVFTGAKKLLHTFAVLGNGKEILKTKEIITLNEIPDDYIIVDPWIRCAFYKKNIVEYWGNIIPEICFTEDDLSEMSKSKPLSFSQRDLKYLNSLKCECLLSLSHGKKDLSRFASEVSKYNDEDWTAFINTYCERGVRSLVSLCISSDSM